MRISLLIQKLATIQVKYGDIEVTGGSLSDDTPLRNVCVTDIDGGEVWPSNVNGTPEPHHIDGVFLSN